jgi:hypothetical protein
MDVVQIAFGFRLHGFRHRVQYVHRFVDPAALFPRHGEHLAQRGPEPQGTVVNGRLRRTTLAGGSIAPRNY